MEPLAEAIGRTEFFAGIDRKLLKKVAESAIVCDYEKGEVIVREGEMGLGMYVILKGRVEVSKDKSGSRISLAELGADQFFAEMSLIDDKPRSATITTLEQTECLLFTRDSFVTLMGKNPQLAIRLARCLAERLRTTDSLSNSRPDAPPSPVETTEPVPAANSSNSNGTASHNGSGSAIPSDSRKAMVQQKLLSAFEWLYTAKAFTRFSVAMLGCPVEGSAANLVEEIRIDDIKVLIFPADEPVEMNIQAYGTGTFGLHVFTPETSAPIRFDPVAIQPGDRFRFSLPAKELSTVQ
jgi:CRP-like cAMP-binding protein